MCVCVDINCGALCGSLIPSDKSSTRILNLEKILIGFILFDWDKMKIRKICFFVVCILWTAVFQRMSNKDIHEDVDMCIYVSYKGIPFIRWISPWFYEQTYTHEFHWYNSRQLETWILSIIVFVERKVRFFEQVIYEKGDLIFCWYFCLEYFNFQLDSEENFSFFQENNWIFSLLKVKKIFL